MNSLLLIVVAAGLVYACRLSGFAVSPQRTPPWWQEFLQYVPVAVFAALIVPGVIREPALSGPKVIALLAAGLVIWWTRRFSLAVLTGLGTLWIILLLM